MAPRAYWKGYLKLSLVSCPVALYPVIAASEKVSLHLVNRRTGNRLKQQLVDSGTGEPVGRESVSRGYEASKRNFVEVEDAELEQIQIESSHMIDIDSFVPRSEIDDRYLNAPYYIVPNDKVGQEAFAVIRDALRDRGMVALARLVLTRREHPIMLEAFDKGLLGVTLRYPYEVRSEKPYFEDIPELKLPQEMRDLAIHIVESKAAHFDPKKFVDHYETALVALLRNKQAGRKAEKPSAEARPGQLVNLMDALRASAAAETRKKRETASSKTRRLRVRKAAS